MRKIIYAILLLTLFASCWGGLAKKATKKAAKMAAEAGLEEGVSTIDENAKAKKATDSKKNLKEMLKNHPKGVSAAATSVVEIGIADTNEFKDKGTPIGFTEKLGNDVRIISAVKTDSRLVVCFNLPKNSNHIADLNFVDHEERTVVVRRESIETEGVSGVKVTMWLSDDEKAQLQTIKSVVIVVTKQANQP